MYRIGQLATAANVSVETIRYYERQSLLQQPEKPATGFRHYPESALQRIIFIKQAQQLGFTLNEIQKLLAVNDQPCKQVQSLAGEKLQTVQKKINELRSLETALKDLLLQCQGNENERECPIITSLHPGL